MPVRPGPCGWWCLPPIGVPAACAGLPNARSLDSARPRVRRDPLRHTVFRVSQFIRGDACRHALPVRRVLLLVRSLDRRSQSQPIVGLLIAVRDSLSKGVEQAERPLRAGIALFRRPAIPIRCRSNVALNTSTVAVESGQANLCFAVVLIGGPAIPR